MNHTQKSTWEKPIDVAVFFDDIINSYAQFEQSAATFVLLIPSLPPESITRQCQQLLQEREELSRLDASLDDILHLSGKAVLNEQIIDDYRCALAKAVIACEAVRDSLEKHKLKILNEFYM